MVRDFQGKEIAIVGMGKSNQALARYLLRQGARVTCFDRKSREELGPVYDEFLSYGATWSLGPDYLDLLPSFRYIFLTPGMKKNQEKIIEAKDRGALISTEIALFLERCKAQVAGITGSAGKTTTATLSGLMLRESCPGVPVYVGGNIGSVLIEKVDDIPENALVVLELSSFQLELVKKSPDVSLFLNVRPNHLDIHESFSEYVEAKKNIFRFQDRDDWCILNFDDPVTRGALEECPGNVGLFSLRSLEGAVPTGEHAGSGKRRAFAWFDGESLFATLDGSSPVRLAQKGDFLVPGTHNISNAMGAALLSLVMGASPEGIRKAIRAFRGVEHRIEFVREVGGIKYFNDSIATSPDRTLALLEALDGPLVLILGGYDKGIGFDELAEAVVSRGCGVVTLGKTAEKIEKAIYAAWEKMRGAKEPDVTRASSLEEAVVMATAKAKPGWAVVLSPACASFDMFTNFEERGRLFKEIVRKIPDKGYKESGPRETG